MRDVILDCDPGVDDALALAMALISKRVNIVGLTTVSGNVSVNQTTLNACRLLDYFGVDIPVAKGASKPLKVRPIHASFHGNDGLGDSRLISRSSTRKPERGGAVDFILRSLGTGVRTIVAIGPLTNIALAFQKDAKTMNRLEELIIMGGAFDIPGNMDSLSEFNFYSDPDAADYIIQRTRVRKVLVPLNVTHEVVLTPDDLKAVADTPSGMLVKTIFGKYQKEYMKTGFSGGPLHDPLAMGFCIDSTFLKLQPSFVRVETRGIYTRGVSVSEERPWVDKRPNVDVASGVDSIRFHDYFMQVVSE
jgi:purine nucleosidase